MLGEGTICVVSQNYLCHSATGFHRILVVFVFSIGIVEKSDYQIYQAANVLIFTLKF